MSADLPPQDLLDFQDVLDRLLAHVRGPMEAELRACVEAQAAREARERAKAVEAAAEQAADEVRRQAQAQLAQFRETARQQLEAARRAAEAELDATRRAAAAEIEGARSAAEAEVGRLRQQYIAELDEARRAAEQAVREMEAARRDADQARRDVEQARQEAAMLRRELDRTRACLGAEAKRLMQVAAAARGCDQADSLSQVLERLMHGASAVADRTAVLLVRGERVQPWRLAGYDANAADFPAAASGLIGAAVQRRGAVTRRGGGNGSAADLPPFARGGEGRDAAAVPVVVGGKVVAVVYADAPAPASPGGDLAWPGALDVLARYAGRVLEAMTIQQALGLGPRTRQSSLAPGTVGGGG